MSNKELAELGARWIGSDDAATFRGGFRGGSDVYVTRLHVRYDANTFPEDIVLLETKDRGNFQGRYIQHHPWKGNASCEAAYAYRQSLPIRLRARRRIGRADRLGAQGYRSAHGADG